MTRIPEIMSREEIAEDKRYLFDAIVGSRGRMVAPFSLLLYSPEVAGRVAHLGAYLRYESTLPPACRELAVLATAREWDNGYEWAAHAPLARREGAREEVIAAIAHRRELSALTEAEAVIVKYCQELLRNRQVSDATLEAARALWGNQGLVDLTATIGYYSMIACVLHAFEAEAPPNTPRLP